MKFTVLLEMDINPINHSNKCKIPTAVSGMNAGNLALEGDFFFVRNKCGTLLRCNYHLGKNDLKIQPSVGVMKHNI